MDSADDLLGGFSSGGASGDAVPQAAPLQPLKRDPDSTDDFEHLQESPLHAPRTATQSFLDMERELLDPRAPADHLADKFTDSESEDTAGESPLHRPAPAPPAPLVPDSAPVLTPAPAPVPVQAPVAPLVEKPAPAPPTPEPKPVPAPIEPPRPAPAPVEPPKPAPAPAEPPKAAPVPAEPPKPAPVSAPQPPAPRPAPQQARAPVAHVIEAEVIFCQMGLGELFMS